MDDINVIDQEDEQKDDQDIRQGYEQDIRQGYEQDIRQGDEQDIRQYANEFRGIYGRGGYYDNYIYYNHLTINYTPNINYNPINYSGRCN
jgi:hypothetical protein